MSSIFDKLDIAPVALAPDPRVDPRVVSALRGRPRPRRSVFHQMEIDLETDDARALIPGIRPRSRLRDDSSLDALRPAMRDAIADIMATDPAMRTRLERGEAMAQAQIADPVIRRHQPPTRAPRHGHCHLGATSEECLRSPVHAAAAHVGVFEHPVSRTHPASFESFSNRSISSTVRVSSRFSW